MIALHCIAVLVLVAAFIVTHVRISVLREDFEIAAKAGTDANTQLSHRLNANYNKLYADQTDFSKIFGERCAKNEAALGQLEEDITVSILDKHIFEGKR